MSLIGNYPCSNVTAPTYFSFLTASCSKPITIVASLGNFTVILVVFLNPSKDLRSPFNYLVVNLSLADLIVGLITAPLGIAFHFFEGFGIPNRPLRKTMHVSFFISCTASLLSLSTLALDRYVAITYPLFYRSRLNATRSLLVSAGVWTVSVLLSMIYFVEGYDKFLFVFANTAVVVTFVLLFTNSKFSSSCELKLDNGTTCTTTRKSGEEASDQVGEKDHKDACCCVDAIFSVFLAIVHLYLHQKLWS